MEKREVVKLGNNLHHIGKILEELEFPANSYAYNKLAAIKDNVKAIRQIINSNSWWNKKPAD